MTNLELKEWNKWDTLRFILLIVIIIGATILVLTLDSSQNKKELEKICIEYGYKELTDNKGLLDQFAQNKVYIECDYNKFELNYWNEVECIKYSKWGDCSANNYTLKYNLEEIK